MESSIVRQNLMTEKGYKPYCGNHLCNYMMPRTKWDNGKSQFTCKCGFVTDFPKEFIDRYKQAWGI